MNYYGNSMAGNGSYLIHYGRKGMKWYQTVFTDLASAAGSGYTGARHASATQTNNRHMGKVVQQRNLNSWNNEIGISKNVPLSAQTAATQSNARQHYQQMARASSNFSTDRRPDSFVNPFSRTYGDQNNIANKEGGAYNKIVANVGSFAGVMRFNAELAGEKISKAAKQTWSSVKQFGASAIAKGKDILSSLYNSARAFGRDAINTITGRKANAKQNAQQKASSYANNTSQARMNSATSTMKNNNITSNAAASKYRMDNGMRRPPNGVTPKSIKSNAGKKPYEIAGSMMKPKRTYGPVKK